MSPAAAFYVLIHYARYIFALSLQITLFSHYCIKAYLDHRVSFSQGLPLPLLSN